MTLYEAGADGYLHEIGSAFDELARQTATGGLYYLDVWGANGDFSPTDRYTLSVGVQ